MAIEIVKGITKEYIPTVDEKAQNTSNYEIQFQTDDNETVWGKMMPLQFFELEAGKTYYFKSSFAVHLATFKV